MGTKDAHIVEYFSQKKLDVLVVRQHYEPKLEEKQKRKKLVYIRTKKVKGENYLYLVKSVWDSKRNTSRQEIVKYLGNAQTVTPDDIPPDYRNNPKITSFLASNIGKSVQEKEKLIAKLRKDVFDTLTNGDRDGTLKIFEYYTQSSTTEEFFEKILKPVMYEVGDLWAANKLSVAVEHIASNIAHDLVKIVGERTSKLDGRAKILVCTPPGEEHNLGCNIIESFLQSKKYRVFNLSPNAPTESVISFISNKKLDLILVSITLDDNIKPGQRFVKKLADKFDIPIMIGGLALENSSAKFDGAVIQDDSLSQIYKLVRNQTSNIK